MWMEIHENPQKFDEGCDFNKMVAYAGVGVVIVVLTLTNPNRKKLKWQVKWDIDRKHFINDPH